MSYFYVLALRLHDARGAVNGTRTKHDADSNISELFE